VPDLPAAAEAPDLLRRPAAAPRALLVAAAGLLLVGALVVGWLRSAADLRLIRLPPRERVPSGAGRPHYRSINKRHSLSLGSQVTNAERLLKETAWR
jgi:hypothetical protein